MKAIFTLIACLTFTFAQAQFLDRIKDRAKDKISQKLEDRVVEAISDEIARAAMKPINKAIDDMLKERYQQDSINGKTDVDYGTFASAFLQPVDLPESYTFDITLECETKDYDGDKTKMEMLMTKDGSAIGFVQFENKKRTLMVFDSKNDFMAVYNEEKKEVQGIPSVLTMASVLAAGHKDEDAFEMTMTKSGETKKIAGYQCDEWKIEDEETTTTAYVAEGFPISWKDSFGPFLRQMLPTTQRDQMPDGMTLQSEAKTKAKNKKSKFEVKKVIESPFTINNTEYKQQSYETEKN